MRQMVALLAVVLLALATYSEMTWAGQREVAPGRYEIETSAGKVLDLRSEDKRTVQQWSKSGADNPVNQRWDIERAGDNYYYIRSAENGAYLAIDGAGSGAKVVVSDRGNRASHVWRFEEASEGRMMIVHRSGLALDLHNGVATDGQAMQVWTPTRQTHQTFKLTQVSAPVATTPTTPTSTDNVQVATSGPGFSGPGQYEIESAATGKVLDLRREDNRTVQQWERGGVRNQRWNVEDASSGYYYIRSAENGAYVGIEGTGNGARVIATTRGNRNSYVWRITDVGNGLVSIVHRSGLALDLHNGVSNNGQPMQVWSATRQPNQLFKMVRTGNLEPDTASNTNPSTDPNYRERPTRERSAYDIGYQAGVNDQQATLSSNYRRHSEHYDRNSEREFQTGYNAGYENTRASGNVGTSVTYNEGYQAGANDSRAALNRNYRRHSNRYSRNTEADFQNGYNAGYDSARSGSGATTNAAYNEGYQAGANDSRAALNRNYRRHSNRYDRSTEADFQNGYNAGYDNARSGGNAGTSTAYNEGYQAGASDSRAALNRNYRRHSNRYDRYTETDFQNGYNAGYDSTRNDGLGNPDLSRMNSTERSYYDDGYRLGQEDARGGYNSNYRRYSRRYNRQYESFFERGYEDGYRSIRR